MSGKIRSIISIVFILFSLSGVVLGASFIPTGRDTSLAPGEAVFKDVPDYEFQFMGQFGSTRYYFRQDRHVILVRDVYGRFEWTTGLNAPFGMGLDGLISAAQTDEERRRVAEPREAMLNATWTAFANSLLTVEFLSGALNPSFISSSAQSGVSSELVKLEDGHFRLDVDFFSIDIFVPVHIFLTETGITYRIFDHELSGENLDSITGFVFTPFLGAAGGARYFFDHEAGAYGAREIIPMTPGYAVIPDGSGALFRFNENNVSFNPYVGFVFGQDPSEATNSRSNIVFDREHFSPRMPVFGVNHGYNQQAFAAWATEGSEFMEIVFMPHGNTTLYNFVYPRFRRNAVINQVFNRRGDSFLTTFPNPNRFDITIEYRFLHGENSGYAGIARAYREFLIDSGVLTPNAAAAESMPVRLDFLMSDVQSSIVGLRNVVVTTAEDVSEIIKDVLSLGVGPVSGGLIGFGRGGATTGRPWAIDFSREIGTRREFRNLFNEMNELGVDLSFAQNYLVFNRFQSNRSRNQAQHVNRWGLTTRVEAGFSRPVTFASFARPDVSVNWFNRQSRRAIDLGAKSVSPMGITERLVSHHTWRGSVTASEVIELKQEAFRDMPVLINANNPNKYLWQYVDRFLQIPVFTSQFILSTDTVPFIQMVLHNTMELYAPYSNFSFYTREDMLRMIDFNVFPSFVLTFQPAHLLAATNSSNFFSTEYEIYRDIILEVYSVVSPVLSYVMNLEWLNREVLINGVILNTYSKGVSVVINYTDKDFIFRGNVIPALSAQVIRYE